MTIIITCDEADKSSINEQLRNGCNGSSETPEECFDAVGDACPYGCNSDGTCADQGSTENGEVPISPTGSALAYMDFLAGLDQATSNFLNDLNNSGLRNKIQIFLFGHYIGNDMFDPEVVSLVNEAIVNLMSYNETNYPGLDLNYPYQWWSDENFVNENFSFDLDDEGFGDLTAQEKVLVILFPAEALFILANKEPAFAETISRFGINGRNDKSDAFRHAFFNAMNANDVGIRIANFFSDAHESEVPANLILEKEMDLFNNGIGLNIGNEASTFVSDEDLSNSAYVSLLDGDLRYLSPLGAIVPPNFGIISTTTLTPTDL